MKTLGKIFLLLAVVILFVLVIVFGPFLPIFAVNTLLPYIVPTMAIIPYNIWTWLAVVALNLTWVRKAKVVEAIKKEKYIG